MSARKTESRLHEIYRRQDPYRFGADYLAATKANRSEAPACSRPSQLFAQKLDRFLQNLSTPERKANCLALYNPDVVEIHDQNLLWPTEHGHPLAALYPNSAKVYPTFRGTLDVADRLGYLHLHPIISIRKGPSRQYVPWPYQGDSLLFIDIETPYCVNWSVKDKRRSFLEPPMGPEHLEQRKRMALRARFEIEAQNYLDVKIRTQPVSGEEIDDIVAANLLKLCAYTQRQPGLHKNQIQDLEGALSLGLTNGTPASVTISRFVIAGRCDLDQGKTVFYQAIWYRNLRPDLFAPILIDRPLPPESTDLLDYYADWFKP